MMMAHVFSHQQIFVGECYCFLLKGVICKLCRSHSAFNVLLGDRKSVV